MKVSRFYFNMFPVNTYVLWDDISHECAIIDAGCYHAKEEETLARFIADNRLTVKYLLATHLHLDHCFGNAFVADTYGVELQASQAEAPVLQQMPEMCRAFGIPVRGKAQPIGKYLTEESVLHIGDEELKVIPVPGHSPGSLAFYAPQSGFVLSGDALFQSSIGRTDLPGGDFDQLITSLRTQLLTLPDETIVYPGHGPETEIGIERTENPFL